MVQLSYRIIIDGFTYEHIAKELTPEGNIASAPKLLQLYVCSSTVKSSVHVSQCCSQLVAWCLLVVRFCEGPER